MRLSRKSIGQKPPGIDITTRERRENHGKIAAASARRENCSGLQNRKYTDYDWRFSSGLFTGSEGSSDPECKPAIDRALCERTGGRPRYTTMTKLNKTAFLTRILDKQGAKKKRKAQEIAGYVQGRRTAYLRERKRQKGR